MVTVSEHVMDGASLVRVVGDLDLDDLPELREVLQTALARHPWVIVDLSAAGIIGSVALSPLLAATQSARRLGGDVLLASPSPLVRTVLRGARLDTAFRSFDTVPQAMSAALSVTGATAS